MATALRMATGQLGVALFRSSLDSSSLARVSLKTGGAALQTLDSQRNDGFPPKNRF